MIGSVTEDSNARVREPLVLQFSYTEDELVSATKHIYRTQYQLPTHIFTYSVIAILGVILFYFDPGAAFPTFVFTLGAVGTYFMYSTYYRGTRSHVERNWKAYGREFKYEFTDDSIKFSDRTAESRFDWGYFESVCETNDFYFLRYDTDLFCTIPKRSFLTSFDEATFRELVNRKLGQIVELGSQSSTFQSRKLESRSENTAPSDWH
jgi:hypothetical protein